MYDLSKVTRTRGRRKDETDFSLNSQRLETFLLFFSQLVVKLNIISAQPNLQCAFLIVETVVVDRFVEPPLITTKVSAVQKPLYL